MGKKLGLFFVAAVSSVLLFTAGAHAFVYLDQNSTLPEGQIADGTLMAANDTVVIAGKVKGDVFCSGRDVQIKGIIEGDVICAAQNLSITGTVTGNVRVMAQTFNLESSIDKNLTLVMQTANLAKSSFVGGDATIFGETINANGNINRDLFVGANSLNISGMVARTIDANVQNLTFASNAVVGTVNYTSVNKAQVADGASIASIEQTVPTAQAKPTNPIIAALAGAAYWFVAMLLIGGAIIIAKPSLLNSASANLKVNLWKSLGWGALFIFFAPAVAILVALTIVGIPLAILIVLAWVIVLIVAQPIAAYFLGGWILSKTKLQWPEMWTNFTSLALGLLILAVLMVIPFLGALIGLLASCIGVGSLKYSKIQSKK